MLGGHGERNGPAKQTNGPRSRSPKDSTSSTARGSDSSIAATSPTLAFPGKGASKGDLTPQELVASAVQDHIGSITTKLFENLQPTVADLVTKVATQATTDLVDRMGNMETSMGEVQNDLKEVRGEVKGIATSVDKLAEQVAQLQANLGTNNTAGQGNNSQSSGGGDGAFGAGFYRNIDQCLVLINTLEHKKVGREALWQALTPLLADAGIVGTSVFLSGDTMDDAFELKFLGEEAVARQHCKHFLASLSLGRGKYKSQTVRDSEGQAIQFFCQPDKNPCQVRREVLAKKLQSHIATLVPDATIWVRKATGTILINKRPLVSVLVQNEEEAILRDWQEARVTLHNLDKDAIINHFATIVSGNMQSSS